MRRSNSAGHTGALVIGGGHGALAIARSLGRRGVPVWIVAGELRVAASSRYVKGCLPWPASLASPQPAEYLVEMAHRHHLEGWVLIAGSDTSAELMARHREVLSSIFQLATSPLEVVSDAIDKRRAYALADRVGVERPRTFYPKDADHLMRLDIEYPAILKPAVKTGWNAFIRAKAWKVRNREEMITRYRDALTMLEPTAIMVQELIPGGNENQFSFAALCRDGVPLGILVARRLRQYPVEFGRCSSLVETIELPEVEIAATRLLSAMKFTGIVEVEFKRDPRDRKLKLLDINPRVWRWIALGPRAGVDFPYLMYRLSRGETVDPVRSIAGVRWVRMATDVLAAARELREGSLNLRGYLNSVHRPLEFSIFALDDPLPALMEVPHLIAADVRRAGLPGRLWRAKSPLSAS